MRLGGLEAISSASYQLAPSPARSATDGIIKGRVVRVLPRAFIPSGGLVDRDLPEDNSSSAGVSPSLEVMGSFPLLRAIGCSARSSSHTSFLSLRLFST